MVQVRGRRQAVVGEDVAVVERRGWTAGEKIQYHSHLLALAVWLGTLAGSNYYHYLLDPFDTLQGPCGRCRWQT